MTSVIYLYLSLFVFIATLSKYLVSYPLDDLCYFYLSLYGFIATLSIILIEQILFLDVTQVGFNTETAFSMKSNLFQIRAFRTGAGQTESKRSFVILNIFQPKIGLIHSFAIM